MEAARPLGLARGARRRLHHRSEAPDPKLLGGGRERWKATRALRTVHHAALSGHELLIVQLDVLAVLPAAVVLLAAGLLCPPVARDHGLESRRWTLEGRGTSGSSAHRVVREVGVAVVAVVARHGVSESRRDGETTQLARGEMQMPLGSDSGPRSEPRCRFKNELGSPVKFELKRQR